MAECRICGKRDCDDDCAELRVIYREHQREKLRDIDIDEITCDVCGRTYGQDSHDLCMEDAIMHNFPTDCEIYWNFCENVEVKELGKQLQEGLIHPLEYAAKVRQLALQEGFTDV